jgi:hypothetical protein
MKVTRVRQSCLLAVLVLTIAAIGASSASAIEYEIKGMPEVGRCVNVPTGTGVYKGSQCLAVEHSSKKLGKYNWIPASQTEKLTFSGAGGESVLTTVGHSTIKCIAANLSGEYTSPKKATVTIEFQGCTNAKKEQCQSNPQNKSEIKTLPLEAELGFIKNELLVGHNVISVGLDLKPTSPLPALVTYECGSVLESARLEGSVIGQEKPIDKMTSEMNLIYSTKTNGEQLYQNFQEGLQDTLSTTYQVGIESTTAPTTLKIKSYLGTNSVPLEVKAYQY